MSTVLLILEILGLVLLVVLFLLMLIIFVRIRFSVLYGKDGLVVKLRILGIPINLFKNPKKEIKKKEQKEQKQTENTEQNLPEKEKFKLNISLIKRLVRDIVTATFKILSKVKIHNLSITSVVNGKDPYNIGVEAGKQLASFSAIYSIVDSVSKIKTKNLDVIPNFAESDIKSEYYICFSMRIWYALFEGIKLVTAYIKLLAAERQLEKQVKQTIKQNL